MPNEEQGNDGAGAKTPEASGGMSIEEAVARMAAADAGGEGGGEAAGAVPGEGGESGAEAEAGAAGEGAEGAEAGEKGGTDEAGEKPEPVEFSAEQQAILEREIGKKVAKFRETEERLTARIEELEAQLSEMPSRVDAGRRATGPDLLAMRPEQLDRLEQDIQDRIDWLEMNQDGYEADPENKDDVSLTRQQVLKALVEHRKQLRAIPRAREEQAERQAFELEAVKAYPELAPHKSDRKIHDDLVRRVPELRKIPNFLMWVGDALRGERARRAEAEAAAKRGPAAKPKPAPKVVAAGAKKPAVAATGGEGGYTMARMIADGGGVDAATRLMMEREKKSRG